jgi:hypothetical protein
MQNTLRTLLTAELGSQQVHLVFHLQKPEGLWVEDIHASIEVETNQTRDFPFPDKEYRVQRRYAMTQPLPDSEPEVVTNILSHTFSAEEALQRLQEFIYLWIGGRKGIQTQVANKELQVQLRAWLQSLEHPDEKPRPFVTARVRMQERASDEQGGIYDERHILRSVGSAHTFEELRHIILLLPENCSAFEVLMELPSGECIGNATYSVDNQIDPATGKRLWLAWYKAFGACADIHKAFSDLYNSSSEVENWVERSIAAEGLHHPQNVALAPPQPDEATGMLE